MEKSPARYSGPTEAWGGSYSVSSLGSVRVVTLSRLVRLALPPLFVSSLPKRAIGFSFPSGGEGRMLGAGLVTSTVVLSMILGRTMGPLAVLMAVWLTGGTAALVLYNSTRERVAFVKELCSTCRLRPLIEEHEAMHLFGESSEEAVWEEARRRYSYDGLNLRHDPRICSFCPIAKKLKDN